jgi:hypothetical protein
MLLSRRLTDHPSLEFITLSDASLVSHSVLRRPAADVRALRAEAPTKP